MRCKNCKEKFEPARFNQKYCLESDCVRVWVESEKTKQWKKTKAKAKQDLMTCLVRILFRMELTDLGRPKISN